MEKKTTTLTSLLLLLCIGIACRANTLQAVSLQAAAASALPPSVAPDPAEKEILIVTSYTSDTKYTYDGINNFIETYKSLGGNLPVVVENMNVFNLKDMSRWARQLYHIRSKHPNAQLMILLGGEAWTAYLSPEYNEKDPSPLPVICARAPKYGVSLPQDTTLHLQSYSPRSTDMIELMRRRPQVKACYAYRYDMDKTLDLIKRLYPATRHLVFLSDNTYNGLLQWALVHAYMQNHPEMGLTMIDGRRLTLEQATDTLKQTPPNAALLIGIWRIDSRDMAYINNSVYAFTRVAPNIPAFSLTSTAIGYWAIGGYVPLYDDIIGRIGKKAYEILHTPTHAVPEYHTLPMHYLFDHKALAEKGIDTRLLPTPTHYLNRPPGFFELYKAELQILLFVCISLLLGTVVSFSFYIKTKRLKNRLLQNNRQLEDDKRLLLASEIKLRHSQSQLRIARDHAEEARKRAEGANHMKNAFVANMSHEIRTPLNAIIGFSSLLVDMYANEDTTQKEFADVIRKNSDALLHVVDDVLDVARLETERPAFAMEECDVIVLCQGIVDSMRLLPQARSIHLSFSPMETNYTLYTDPQRLQQILKNLLHNALKFTPQGGSVSLALHLDSEHRQLLFSVSDTGCGIPAGMRERIFERFAKVDEFVQGTGLGLTICRMIIRHLGGDIWVDPDYTGGTRFIFTHPLPE